MWLPSLECKNTFNVVTETNMIEDEIKSKRNPLALFRKLVKLRQIRSVRDGNIFYPWQDRDIFTFMR